jgi:acyl-CoA thioester hydrolase
MNEEKSGTELRLRIDWSELDLFGHVNNVMYFKYIQAARVHFWDQTGLSRSFEKDQLGAMLLSAQCHFKQPLFYPGNIHIRTKLGFIKNTSFGLTHSMYNEKNELVATGEDVIVFYDYQKHHKVEIPDWLRLNMENIAII